VFERFRSEKRSERLRALGWLVLVVGLVAAAATYGVAFHYADEALNDVNALGYRRSLQHGVGAMMGRFGLMLTEWQEAWRSPLGMTAIVAVCGGLFAAYFFRAAWVLDDDEREERLHSRHGEEGQGHRHDQL
jgi:membrane associated rhomboid family serine protease